MNLLAIDTSTEVASIALLVNNTHTCVELAGQKTHAQSLLPEIDNLMQTADFSLHRLDGIIFGCGPGSFTGLRVACSVAKGLAYAHSLPLIPVSSLSAIAFAARSNQEYTDLPVLAVLDARMQELYWGYFTPEAFHSNEQVSPASDLLIPEQKVVLAGTGIDWYWDAMPQSLKAQVCARLDLFPHASAMIRLAQQNAMAAVSPAAAEPVYIRNKVTQGDSRG